MGAAVSTDAAIAASDAVGEAVARPTRSLACASRRRASAAMTRRACCRRSDERWGMPSRSWAEARDLGRSRVSDSGRIILQRLGPPRRRTGPAVLGPALVRVRYRHGMEAVGRKGVVTDAGGGTIVTIDHEPALAFFEQYLGSGAKHTPANRWPSSTAMPMRPLLPPRPAVLRRGHRRREGGGGVTPGAHVQLTIASHRRDPRGTRSAVQKRSRPIPTTPPAPRER